mmetsp:Transcript_13481/g.19053  ORF Transcript_13481/g.19053 Transcript_13481/m.19053 type:complete len:503 (+) Transcript_13481:92-1600(+)
MTMSLPSKRKLLTLSLLTAAVINFCINDHEYSAEDSVSRRQQEDLIGRMLSLEELYENEDEEGMNLERELQLEHASFTYYIDLSATAGMGECLDDQYNRYDYAGYDGVTSEITCARVCSKSIMVEEFRGFGFDNANNYCQCYFDDQQIPKKISQKDDDTDDGRLGREVIFTTQNDAESSVRCFAKNEEALGSPLDKYEEVVEDAGCDVFAQDVDLLSWTFRNKKHKTAEHCAKMCIRFDMMQTHIGLSQNPVTGDCDCFFMNGEAPLKRVVPKRTKRTENVKLSVRREQGSTHATCYRKIPIESSTAAPAQFQGDVWINEIHYRNKGADKPFLEIVGPRFAANKPGDLYVPTGYEIIFYQARDGSIFKQPIALAGYDFDQNVHNGWGFLTIELNSTDIRKGKQGGDGIALTRGADCLQFFSYTHTGVNIAFEASVDPCAGVASVPMGVLETRETLPTQSLQLQGTGSKPSDFTWTGPIENTKGYVNTGQELPDITQEMPTFN